MSKVVAFIAVSIIHFAVSQSAFSQINIKLPKIPKIVKQRPEPDKTGQGQDTTTTSNETGKCINEQGQSKKLDESGKCISGKEQPKLSDGKLIYGFLQPTDTPVLLKNSVYIQAITHNEYWKAPNESNYSSWVPSIRFQSFASNKPLNYAVEYFNPDGSAWYSEKLESEDTEVKRFQSERPYGGILDTKSTVGTGLYSFKITDQDTKQVIYQGKFKVGKFSTASRPQEKNKFAFFVDHDWLMPFGTVGFRQYPDQIGPEMPVVSVWLKGYGVSAGELEGRIFFKGQQIASTKEIDDRSGRIGGPSDFDERAPEFAASHSPLNYWKRWQFQWENLRFDNGAGFNRESFRKVHYADKNPGDYVVKIYRNGTQIREMNFSIGPDGRFVVPAYTNQIFALYHAIVLPVKVMGTAEKWNVNSWKTDAFYGNPISGFAAQ